MLTFERVLTNRNQAFPECWICLVFEFLYYKSIARSIRNHRNHLYIPCDDYGFYVLIKNAKKH